MDAKLAAALGPYTAYFEEQPDGKLKCLVNGHCFPAGRPEQIASFVGHMLYCALTGQLLEKSLAAVKKHMGGKRFVRAKARFVADDQDLKPEPSLRDFGIILGLGV
ncbi:hypothetical protein TSOC_008928 [Tetrabaena socialis]|uniref:Surfeit locus protein 2 n=1 Tax=Tetrabaena socialis TaxID=47790 RepID=A0A2J7ZX05_9CHLO|nr:hypothetical protein TSOC_008928 [Tetrabaena socialis]|eukprot:PNH04811.1 hypothetical protein TSOC_008928 [Tetrabaena socialis]